MQHRLSAEPKSAERLAFERYLRTGFRAKQQPGALEHKFNPYHDPRDGRFTFAPGGPRSLSRVVVSDRRGLSRAKPPSTAFPTDGAPGARQSLPFADQPGPLSNAVFRSDGTPAASLRLVQYRPGPRGRMGSNNGPPITDPMTLQQVFPGLANAPAGGIVAMAGHFLDISGPARQLTTRLTEEHVSLLIRQIKTLDPNYVPAILAFPTTPAGQANLVNHLRMERAVAFYRARGELRPLQVEITRYLQSQTDAAYTDGVMKYNLGRLNVKLSHNEAIGNHVDRIVRSALRRYYNQYAISISRDGPLRIIGREYDSSGTDLNYRIPDARIGDIALDVTLTRKTLSSKQIRGFFNADFKPKSVIAIRPSQIEKYSTYIITRPGKS